MNKEKEILNANLPIIYVYRYIWLFKNSENTNVKILSGPLEEHEKFIDIINKDKNISMASRVYLHEYDISKIEYFETIKKDGEKDEKI